MGADLADMQLIGKFNKEIRLLLCVIDTFSKHSWVIPLKDKKVITIINTSQNIFISSKKKKKTYKICVNKESKFYQRSMKSWLEKNTMDMYSTLNEGKSVVAE